jgi:hypothetical protein
MMAGGAELRELSHELEALKDIPAIAAAARELAAEAPEATVPNVIEVGQLSHVKET